MKVRHRTLARALTMLPPAHAGALPIVRCPVPAEETDASEVSTAVDPNDGMRHLTFLLTPFQDGPHRWYEYTLDVADAQ